VRAIRLARRVDLMAHDRDHYPAELERALMLEAGYRCSVPACKTVEPLQIDHIVDYAKVKEHQFENMIVLCANCHNRKGKGPRRLDRKALRVIKRNLGVINARYNDLERRVLQHFVDDPHSRHVILPETPVLFGYLIKDGLLEGVSDGRLPGVWWATAVDDDEQPKFMTRAYRLTVEGKKLVNKLRDSNEAV
jgi:hypothetical protein